MAPTEGLATVQPFVRLDFQPYDPSFCLSLLQTMHCGGQRLLSAGLAHLMRDFELGRPTHLGATPAIWNALHQDFCALVSSKLSANPAATEASAEVEAAAELRRRLGNRLAVASSGGAPLAPQVLRFVRERLRVDITDLYGSRESGGIARDGVVYRGVEVRLQSLPELGYLSTNVPARGEICVHSPRLIPGYWGAPEQTAAAFVSIDGKKYYRKSNPLLGLSGCLLFSDVI
jgi:long-subunit acyl-CoA synthetase (AMP-forming)